ncbi:hypothetical protein [Streptomyces albidoflavus]|uniref:hypothetical protein n=1 Tax=Streptomyces albidoflavus TaxID=1886 RepID=UPI00101F626B|nr:hypothetical protein [Streptomyces albidoflavus]
MIEYAAVIALCGVPTRGGWSLEYLSTGEAVPVVRDLPLPLSGMSGLGHGRIGWVDHLAYLRDSVVARGFIDSTQLGRSYAGTVELGLTRIVMEGETFQWGSAAGSDGQAEVVRCEDWRVGGASVQVAPAWDLPRPEIYYRGIT